MSLIYREVKGGPLTAQEVDDNFRQLDQRLKALEALNVGRKLHQISLEGQDIVMYDDAGLEVSRATIPTVGLTPRGKWDQNMAYACRDIVTHEGMTYICINAQKPGAFNQQDWQILLTMKEKSNESK